MSDVDDLLAAFDSGRLVRPSADAPNIVDLANVVIRLSGSDRPEPTPNSARIADLIGTPDHLVLVIADGLGLSAVRTVGRDTWIRDHLAGELRTVYPSSTPVVFTTLATGTWPAAHGVPGWDIYLSEVDCVATIIKFERRSDRRQLTELGMSEEQAFPVGSLVGGPSYEALSIKPQSIVDGVYSRYWAGSAAQQGYKSVSGAVDTTIRRVRQAKGPTLTALYIPDVDTAIHELGSYHPQVKTVIQGLDREMRKLSEGLPKTATLVITADHGLSDAADSDTHQIEPHDTLVGYLRREPWGNKRIVNFDVHEDNIDRFEQHFKSRFGEWFYLLVVDEAEGLELFGPGPMAPITRRRLGTHLAISRNTPVIKYKYPTTKPDPRVSISHHSGLTSDEMLVPLVIA